MPVEAGDGDALEGDDRFLRDEAELEGFRERLRTDPGEGGPPASGTVVDGARSEVTVEVPFADMASDEAGYARRGEASTDAGARPVAEEEPGPAGFWGEGFRPRTPGEADGSGETEVCGGAEAGDEVGEESLGAKLAELEPVDVSEA